MAVYWNLGLVTRNRDDAEACVAYFLRQKLVERGREVALQVSWQAEVGAMGAVLEDEEITEESAQAAALVRDASRWFISVWPRGMNHGSPEGHASGLTDEAARARVAAAFDGWLEAAPAFQAAFFGSEAFDFFFAGGLHEIDAAGIDGLFVDEAMWAALGRPEAAQAVAPGRRSWGRSLVP
jgi:hypothetical protein